MTGNDIIGDALATCFVEHFAHAPTHLKDRFYSAVSPTVAGDAMLHLARIRFGRHRFEFDTEGSWAIVTPIYRDNETLPVDLAAFDVDDCGTRRVYRGYESAVGLSQALSDTRFHPQNRALIHASVWTWLRAECCGVLPVDWNKTALALKARKVGLVADSDGDAKLIERNLRLALSTPSLFVKKVAA
jgi:hypothetical protein